MNRHLDYQIVKSVVDKFVNDDVHLKDMSVCMVVEKKQRRKMGDTMEDRDKTQKKRSHKRKRNPEMWKKMLNIILKQLAGLYNIQRQANSSKHKNQGALRRAKENATQSFPNLKEWLFVPTIGK